jgi:hypothetical protein
LDCSSFDRECDALLSFIDRTCDNGCFIIFFFRDATLLLFKLNKDSLATKVHVFFSFLNKKYLGSDISLVFLQYIL